MNEDGEETNRHLNTDRSLENGNNLRASIDKFNSSRKEAKKNIVNYDKKISTTNEEMDKVSDFDEDSMKKPPSEIEEEVEDANLGKGGMNQKNDISSSRSKNLFGLLKNKKSKRGTKKFQ